MLITCRSVNFKILYNADDEPEEDEDRVRRLKLVKERALDKAKSDESSVSNKDDNYPNSDKTQKKQADAEDEKKKDDDAKVRVLDKAKSDESSVSNKDDNDPNSDKTQKKQADAEDEKKKDDD